MKKKIILFYTAYAFIFSYQQSTLMAAEAKNFTYDAKGRLVEITKTGTTTGNITVDYEFDKADNRIRSKTELGPS